MDEKFDFPKTFSNPFFIYKGAITSMLVIKGLRRLEDQN